MKVDIKVMKQFVDGTIETLKVQCATQAIAGKMFSFSPTAPHQAKIDIVGDIKITSDIFNGSIQLCFPKETYVQLMSRMLGESITEINRDSEDGASELMNIIFGYAKRKLNDEGSTIKQALPGVIKGDKILTRFISPDPVIALPFDTDIGNFLMEIAVNYKNGTQVA